MKRVRALSQAAFAVLAAVPLFAPSVCAASTVTDYIDARTRLTQCEIGAVHDEPLEHCVAERVRQMSLALVPGALVADEKVLRAAISAASQNPARSIDEVSLYLALMRNLLAQERNAELLTVAKELANRTSIGPSITGNHGIEGVLIVVQALVDAGKVGTAADLLESIKTTTADASPVLQGLFLRSAGDIRYLQSNPRGAFAYYRDAAEMLRGSDAGRELVATVLSREAIAAAGVDPGRSMKLVIQLRADWISLLDRGERDRWRLLDVEFFNALSATAFHQSAQTRMGSYYAAGFRCGPHRVKNVNRNVEPYVSSPRSLLRYNLFLGMNAATLGEYAVARNCFNWAYSLIHDRHEIDQSALVAPLVGALVNDTLRGQPLDIPRILDLIYTARGYGDGVLPEFTPEMTLLRMFDYSIASSMGMPVDAYVRAVALLESQTQLQNYRGVASDPSGLGLMEPTSEWAVTSAWAAAHRDRKAD